MSLLNDTFITDDVEDLSFDPIPANKYVAQIIGSEIKTTSSGTGEYISLRYEVLEGQYTGRTVFQNLNIVNQSEKTVQIAKSQLKQICVACGIKELHFDALQELHGIPLNITVKVRPPVIEEDENGVEYEKWPANNDIKKVEKIGGETSSDEGDAPWD